MRTAITIAIANCFFLGVKLHVRVFRVEQVKFIDFLFRFKSIKQKLLFWRQRSHIVQIGQSPNQFMGKKSIKNLRSK